MARARESMRESIRLGIFAVVLNYLFSLTKMSFWQYAAGSLIGMIPATPLEQVVFWVGLVVAVALTVLLAYLAHASLQRTAPEDAHDARKDKR